MTTETMVEAAAGARDARALGIFYLFIATLMTICSLAMYMEPHNMQLPQKADRL